MSKTEIVIRNLNDQRVQVPQGMTLAEIANNYVPKGRFPWLCALVNNEVEILQYNVYNSKVIKFLDVTSDYGMRSYQSSLIFLLYKCVLDLYPEARLRVEHSLTCGAYCTIEGIKDETKTDVAMNIRNLMVEKVRQDIPFETRRMLTEDAIKLLTEHHNQATTIESLKNCGLLYVHMRFFEGVPRILNNVPVFSTGSLECWDFRTYNDGFLLQWPDLTYPEKLSLWVETPKLLSIFNEHRNWVSKLGVPTIEDLNRQVRNHQTNHLIQVSEALHEKKYAEIADMIYQRRDKVKMVLLAGPSSSGKTTSCRRLSVQLSVLGFDVQQVSLDDYFVDRSRTPKDEKGDYDFEALEALDIELLNNDLNRMFKGERVNIPTYDFKAGAPFYEEGKYIELKPESILVVEGIHALNPKLTAQVDNSLKFKIYVSAMTQVCLDDLFIIHTSDNRLLRRIVRDNNFRGWGAHETIKRWPSVRAGERKHIFPYQEQADVMFNSALLYELGVLRTFAEPQLKRVPQNCEEYATAQRLLRFVSLIEPIDPKFIPPTSIMCEFLGGSSFKY